MPSSIEFAPFAWQELQPQPIIGVDEVGRGCLAGRVYAAACVCPVDYAHASITDSKKLSEKRREEYAIHIRRDLKFSIGFAEVEEIDSINILQASLLAMRRAVEGLGLSEGHVIVDGNQRIPGLDRAFKQTTLVKGDLRALPVAAASIIAKVERDHYMQQAAEAFPGYGFEKHKGYSALEHRLAIQKLGPSPMHRKTFAGVKEYIPGYRPVEWRNESPAF